MKIKYLSGPKAGQEEHVPNDVGRFGISSGLAELVGESPADQASRLPKFGDAGRQIPSWEVTTYTGVERKYLAIKFSLGQRTEFYSGPPKDIRRIGGWTPPQTIISEYAKQYRAYPELRDACFSMQLAAANGSAAQANERASNDKQSMDDAVKGGRVPHFRPIALD
jgi:hypothetical protein